MRRKTNEEYVKECRQLGIDLPIEEYINALTKIKHKCSKGHIYKQTPGNHIKGHGCPKCGGKQKKTTKDYIEECKVKGYDLPVEEYINSITPIKHKCKRGHIYKQTPGNHINKGQKCPYCSGSHKRTTKEYIKECKECGYDLPIESYINVDTKVKHKCNQCGYIYYQTPCAHLQGQGCPTCYGNNRKTTKQYIDECKKLNIDLPIKGEKYINNRTKIKHLCRQCGSIYEQAPKPHLKGQGCPTCGALKRAESRRKTTKHYIKECIHLGLDLPIEDYVNAKTPIKHKCKNGHIYKQRPESKLSYSLGCPCCSQSHGEKYIQKYLDKHNIPYIAQKKFNGLKDKQPLSYDFYLPKQNVLIEYQGIQHFESVSFDGKVSSDLEKQQYHDKLKREYAKNNGYKLLEPTYSLDTQDKVNRYLDIHLKG